MHLRKNKQSTYSSLLLEQAKKRVYSWNKQKEGLIAGTSKEKGFAGTSKKKGLLQKEKKKLSTRGFELKALNHICITNI